ncbi:MAG: macro domain-containing protein [Bryobacterales bacterium]|nr:macro domain-containing protein [Bryobacteraceae bacterium]MDW8353509.1 macro domain-containing protein [Bryobacterales bacterium]
MVTVKIGDLFESKAQTWVNTVNCVGVMGKGVALEFKKRFPDMFDDYVERCRSGQVKLGRPYLYKRVVPPWILNFPTKEDWRAVSRLDAIEEGLRYLEAHYRQWGIESLAVPPLGCGQGQLEWRVVGPTLYRYLKRLDIPVELYAPFETPHEELKPEFLDQPQVASARAGKTNAPYRIEPGWIAIVEILQRLEREPYHPPVGRTSFQKIAYFAAESGIPIGLRFGQGSYGPHAPDLKRKIAALVNNRLIYEQKLGRMLAVRVGPTYPDARKAYEKEIEKWEPVIERIADLFMRMDTRRAEVAASVHFAAGLLKKSLRDRTDESAVLEAVMKWKSRRRPAFDRTKVAITIRNLNLLRWIDVEPSNDLPVPDEEALYA